MIKSELIEELASRTGISPVEAKEIFVDRFFQTIKDAIIRGDRVELRGFCSWQLREYGGYIGRCPRTGESVTVPPKILPFFKPGKDLLDIVNDDGDESGRQGN